MDQFLIFLKKFIPADVFRKWQPRYHYVLNYVAALLYRHPSEDLIVIGVTGTTGKTTVVYMIAHMLRNAGVSVGYTSTAMFGDGEKEWLNDKKMTMVGRFFTQKMLRRMVTNGCRVAIVETTSEGAVQFRHRFINYDTFVFTGLYPEHIDAHGSFAQYKEAKKELFRHLTHCSRKKLRSLVAQELITMPKTIIVNGDDQYAEEFLAFPAQKKMVFLQHNKRFEKDIDVMPYEYHGTNHQGVQMTLDGMLMQLQLLGSYTATNIAAVGCVGRSLGFSNTKIKKGLAHMTGVPGRLEKIPNVLGATIIVDYAFEPVAVKGLYETVAPLAPRRIIHILGSCGGGRDIARRAKLGELAGKNADIVIITNEDPYDDDPMEIIEAVARGARRAGKQEGKDLLVIEDRHDAIVKGLHLMHDGDVVLITGKGSEQSIMGKNGKKIPWDDRVVVKQELATLEEPYKVGHLL